MTQSNYDFSELDRELARSGNDSFDFGTGTGDSDVDMNSLRSKSKLGVKLGGKQKFLHYNRKWKIISILVSLAILVFELEVYEGIAVIRDFISVEPERNPLKIFANALVDHPIITLAMILLAFVLGTTAVGTIQDREGTEEDERGFLLDKTNTAGASRFMTDKEKRETFLYLDQNRPEGNILGVDRKSKELITVPFEGSSFSNRNIALFGPPGMRKTSGVLIPNIFSNIQAGNSIVCTDPKGELYKETYAAALLNGYNVRVFNILGTQFMQSDGWDCMKMIRETTDIGSAVTVAQIFANILLANTGSDGKSGDEFWANANLNCLTLALLYVGKANSFVPYHVRTNFTESAGDGMSSSFDSERTIREVYALITSEDMADIISQAINNDPTGDGRLLESSYHIWNEHRERDSIKAGLGIKLNILQSEQVANILSTDDIDFRELAEEKTIIYIVCADNDSTYKSLLTLFVTFMFKDTTAIADELPGSTLPRPLFVILEECGNIGQIPNMSKYVSTVRSRNIGMLFCFQTVGQMIDIYGSKVDGRYEWETILAGCSIHLCLGGNDETTKKHFSDRAGTMSTINIREGEARNKLFPEAVQDVTVLNKNRQTTIGSRPVLFPDEIGHIKKDEILISPATENVTIEKKYFYKNHPLFNAVLVDRQTGEIIGEHLTKEHMPEWRVKRLIASGEKAPGEILSDEQRYIAKLAKRPEPAAESKTQDGYGDMEYADRSYSSFRRREE